MAALRPAHQTGASGYPRPRSFGSTRLLYAIALAATCFVVLAARVHGGFERIRFRVVIAAQDARERSLEMRLPDLSRLADMPVAVVLRLRGTSEPMNATVRLDDTALTRLSVPRDREIRVDLAIRVPQGQGHRLRIDGDRAGWQLTYLEIANVYGYSKGALNFVIVPSERPQSDLISRWALVLFALAVATLHPRTDWPHGRVSRRLYRIGAGIVLLLFAVTLLAELFTQYRILLSPATFVLGFVVLYADPLARTWRRSGLHAVPYRRYAPFLPHAAVIFMVLWSIGQLYRPDTGFTTLILFGQEFEPRALPALRSVAHHVNEGWGYDGQFYAQLALDPLLRSDSIAAALDLSGYRARRILFPWIAYILGLGQPWFVLQAYALLNVVSWLLLAWLLLRWLPPRQIRSTAAWAACLLGHGLLASMRQALPDGPSTLVLALGVTAVEQNRRWLAAVVLGASGLGRDTNILGAPILVDERPARRTIWRLALQGTVVVAPLLIWMGYLWHLNLSPGTAGSSNFAAPFTAYAAKWSTTVGELRVQDWEQSFARYSLLSLVGLTVQAAVLLWQRDWRSPWWRMGVAYVGLWIVLGPKVWEGDPGAVTRVVFPMTVAFNVLLPRMRGFWPLWVLGNANVLHGLEFIRAPWFSQLW
jgi:hypothetical protein